MRDAARVKAAIDILDARMALPKEDAAALSRVIADWGRRHRFAGSKDRRAIADIVFDAVRRRTSSAASMGSESGRALALAALVRSGSSVDETAALCVGGDRAPDPISADERARLSAIAAGRVAVGSNLWARCDWPEWLWPDLLRGRSEDEAVADASAVAQRGAADLRVNSRRGSVSATIEALREDGVTAGPTPLSPVGVRCAVPPVHSKLSAYCGGLVEPQDAASQAVALLAAAATAQFGPRVLDACCGGGGKALAIGASSPDLRVDAFDVDPRRTVDLSARTARLGVDVRLLRQRPDAGAYDVVLVDAPCSGSGSWGRAPDAKWALTADRLRALRAAQCEAIALGASALRPGGALIYATCSLLACENEDCARHAAEAHGLAPTPIGSLWRAAGLLGDAPAPDAAGGVALRPAIWGADGFYVAAFA